ncbi:MAG TPA: DUF4276 family protein [Phycisphaerae bacterium]|nr:DUF4276 family protein [Phycisphaerae bacterium]HRR84010.1 DUF4276 family protein [Phycisphaerae bacterium]
MHIEFLVEELSAKAALDELLPRLLGTQATFDVHAHQGKHDLLACLPSKIRAYAGFLPADWRVVVLLDLDREDCKKLKRKLDRIVGDAGLRTKMSSGGQAGFQVLNRIAIEELEAWFFGDVAALHAAYPRVPLTLGQKSGFRDPDRIKGGTWERLEQVLQRHGYFKSGYPKVTAAREIAKHMDPSRNRSRSFQVFRDGLRALLES